VLRGRWRNVVGDERVQTQLAPTLSFGGKGFALPGLGLRDFVRVCCEKCFMVAKLESPFFDAKRVATERKARTGLEQFFAGYGKKAYAVEETQQPRLAGF